MRGLTAPVAAIPHEAVASIDAAQILDALPVAVLLTRDDRSIRYANPAAEQLFSVSAAQLTGLEMTALIPSDSPLHDVLARALAGGQPVSEYGLFLETPRIGTHVVDVHVAAVSGQGQGAVISISEHSMAHRLDRQLSHRGAARSVTAMAAMLAHEVKNPLSGIRGAAQLLERGLRAEDRPLTRLICEETDRICGIVDRMEVFSDRRVLERGPVNIHKVLDHVRRLAFSGFASQVRFFDRFDPSLPPVLGNRDQLVQVFLNLVKNAAEAVPELGGEIVLSTSYQTGVRVGTLGGGSRTELPLVIAVQDNGVGIADDIRPHLFDAFVTSKTNGSGLGLALVAKIVGDHGGVIEFESQPRRTVFRVRLPIAAGMPAEEE
jgi:two-component system, NtrC family, nitrogen regulation sensor histidine kinase GlnL